MSVRSRIGRYSVRIYGISCEDLVGKDKGGTSDPYCKFDFDKFRKFNTKVIRKTLNPVFDTDETFNYATQFADRLQYKHLVITVQDKDFWGKDYIGSCKVDLHTLLTGPINHTLAIINKGNPAGRIKFKVEMIEICNLKVFFKSVCLSDLPKVNHREPSVRLNFRTDVTEHKVDVNTPIIRETRNPEWSRLEQLRFNTNLRELMSTTLKVQVLTSGGDVIGNVKIPFRSFGNNTGDDVVISLPIQMVDAGRTNALFNATIYYKDFPTAAHMVGGEHTDNGIIDAQYFHPLAERPKYVKVYGAEGNERKRANNRNGVVAASAASGAITTGTTLVTANPRPSPPAAPPPLPTSRPPVPRHYAPNPGSLVGGAVVGATVIGAATLAGGSASASSGAVTPVVPVSRSTMTRTQSGRRHAPIVEGAVIQPQPTAPQPIVTTVTPTIVQPQIVQPPRPQSYLDKLHPADRERTLRLGLPAPWSCHVANDGRVFYVNHSTKKTQWTNPTQAPIVNPIPPTRAYGQPQPPTGLPIARPVIQQMSSMSIAPTKSRFPPVDTQQLYTLTNMGFHHGLATEALARNGNDLARSIQWLSTSPPPLSPSWDLRVDKKSHRLYYANKEGKFTQWDRPIIGQNHEPMLRSLLSMGFPRRLAVEALAHYKGDAQSATNWILYNNPKPLPSHIAILVENGYVVYINKQNNQRYTTRPYKPTF